MVSRPLPTHSPFLLAFSLSANVTSRNRRRQDISLLCQGVPACACGTDEQKLWWNGPQTAGRGRQGSCGDLAGTLVFRLLPSSCCSNLSGRPLASCSLGHWGHIQCHFCLPDRMLPSASLADFHPQSPQIWVTCRTSNKSGTKWGVLIGRSIALNPWKEEGWTWGRHLAKSATQGFVLTKRTTERQKREGGNKKSRN